MPADSAPRSMPASRGRPSRRGAAPASWPHRASNPKPSPDYPPVLHQDRDDDRRDDQYPQGQPDPTGGPSLDRHRGSRGRERPEVALDVPAMPLQGLEAGPELAVSGKAPARRERLRDLPRAA